MSEIHPLAHVDPKAEIGANVRIAPFCHVGAGVKLGDGCVLHPHVTLMGTSEFGRENVFFPQCVLGVDPQDVKYRGGPTRLIVGDRNIFREMVTIHRGTEIDETSCGTTRIGSHNLLMVGVHVAHDADIADHVILANNVLIAGHVRIENCVNISGSSAMHHFVTIGRNAFVCGMTRITHDVPPFVTVEGYNQDVRGANIEGMRRWRIAEESQKSVKAAARLLFPPKRQGGPVGRTSDALDEIEQNGLMSDECVRYLVEFMRRKLQYGVYGRVREHMRKDTPEHRMSFYGAAAGGVS